MHGTGHHKHFHICSATLLLSSNPRVRRSCEASQKLRGCVQDPANADKLTRVQNELDKTKAIMHQTIESVLDRGEKLDDLVNKSDQLSYASKQFYKQAKKTNSCWGMNCSLS